MLQEAKSWPLTLDVDMLRVIFRAMCPHECQARDALPSLGSQKRDWFHRWLGIIRRHLPEHRQDPGNNQDTMSSLDGVVEQVVPDPYMGKPPAADDAAPSSRDQAVQAGGGIGDRVAEVLVTAASSVEQVSARMPALLVPDGECVAFTVVASLRTSTMTSPELANATGLSFADVCLEPLCLTYYLPGAWRRLWYEPYYKDEAYRYRYS